MGKEFLLEAFGEPPQRTAHFHLDDFGGECDVGVALEEDHGDLVLPLFESGNHALAVESLALTPQLEVVEEEFVFGLDGAGAGVEFVDDEAVVLVEAGAHLQLPPDVLQHHLLPAVALLQVEVEFVGVPLGEVVLGQRLHRLYDFSCVGQALQLPH